MSKKTLSNNTIMSLTELEASISGPTPEPRQDTGNPSEEIPKGQRIHLTTAEYDFLRVNQPVRRQFLRLHSHTPVAAHRYLAQCMGVELPPAPKRRGHSGSAPRPRNFTERQNSIFANVAKVKTIVQRRIEQGESLCWVDIMPEAGLSPTWITSSNYGSRGWHLKQEIREAVEKALRQRRTAA